MPYQLAPKNPDLERQVREISHLIDEITEKHGDETSFQKIKHILDFTTRAQIPISEDNVREHLGFFKSLFDQLNQDLSKLLHVQGSEVTTFEDLLNVLQFSFAMNFDGNFLWLKLYQALNSELSHPTQRLEDLMKFLSVLENLE
jgi:predicted PurR-regulated permease PerM